MNPNQKAPITIFLLELESEKVEALAYIEGIARSRHNATPPAPPQVLFAAKKDNDIVGTIGLDMGTSVQPLPLEHIYQFATDLFLHEFDRTQVAQYGRWMASVERISLALAYIATVYALAKGKTRGWFEAKPLIASKLRNIGMELTPIPHTRLLLERVPETGRAYYTEQPEPMIYSMYFEPFKNVLESQINSLTTEGVVAIDLSFLHT